MHILGIRLEKIILAPMVWALPALRATSEAFLLEAEEKQLATPLWCTQWAKLAGQQNNQKDATVSN